ncbi:MAG: hypothetical protein KBT03_00480 [Bacteroidales bacterium]|nr:hypothetical protein [Candidatus Scybalousia scybalohippi]
MDINSIASFVNSTGFPIACCVAMYIQNNKYQKALEELKLTMAQLVNELKEHNNCG